MGNRKWGNTEEVTSSKNQPHEIKSQENKMQHRK